MQQASRRTLTVYSPTTARARGLRRGPMLRELRTARRCRLAPSHVRLQSYAKNGRISYARLLHPGGRRGRAHFYELLFVEASHVELCLPLDQRSGRLAQFNTPEFGLPANRWLPDSGLEYLPQRDPLSPWLSSALVPSRPLSEFSVDFACTPVPYEPAPTLFVGWQQAGRSPRNITSSSWSTCSAPRAARTRGAAPHWHVECLRDSR